MIVYIWDLNNSECYCVWRLFMSPITIIICLVNDVILGYKIICMQYILIYPRSLNDTKNINVMQLP